jgi:hypothetical protein
VGYLSVIISIIPGQNSATEQRNRSEENQEGGLKIGIFSDKAKTAIKETQ